MLKWGLMLLFNKMLEKNASIMFKSLHKYQYKMCFYWLQECSSSNWLKNVLTCNYSILITCDLRHSKRKKVWEICNSRALKKRNCLTWWNINIVMLFFQLIMRNWIVIKWQVKDTDDLFYIYYTLVYYWALFKQFCKYQLAYRYIHI